MPASAWRCLWLAFLLSISVGRPSVAEVRVALVIGIGAYREAPALLNPANDARDMAATLRRLNFQVEEGIDLDTAAMRKALRNFVRLLDDADVGLVYYAGHALQVERKNYLLPVDAKPERESDLIFQAIDLSDVLEVLEERPRTSLVFLDACRNNPLARDLARSLGRERSQVVAQGLASVESGVGTLISFATQPGNVALDGKGDHSPFTAALLAHIETPDVEIQRMLRRVRLEVIETTGRRQVPWENSSLTGDFYFDPIKPRDSPMPPPQPERAAGDDLVVWKVIKDSRNPTDFEIFQWKYPNSQMADFARARRAELSEQPGTRPDDQPWPPLVSALAPSGGRQQATTDDGEPPAPIAGQTARAGAPLVTAPPEPTKLPREAAAWGAPEDTTVAASRDVHPNPEPEDAPLKPALAPSAAALRAPRPPNSAHPRRGAQQEA